MADVFLSYADEDKPRAEQLAGALLQNGWAVWWSRDMLPGSPYRRVIAQELERAKSVVVLWSQHSISSDWVCDEAEDARDRGCLVPALIDPVRPPHGFRGWQAANLIDWTGNSDHPGLGLLLKGIEVQVRRGTEAAGPPPPPPPQPLTQAPRSRLEQPARSRTPAVAPPMSPSVTQHGGYSPESAQRRITNAQGLFLCYRREDTEDVAARLHDRLTATFGRDQVFMDIDTVPLGVDFVAHVEHQMSSCGAVVVLIGRNWLTATDRRGRRRIDNEDDLVRAEIRAALQQKVPVIPVTVQNASMPGADDLPEDIRSLARRNGIQLRPEQWKDGVERLLRELTPLIGRAGTSNTKSASSPVPAIIETTKVIQQLKRNRRDQRIFICYPDDAKLWAVRLYERIVANHGFDAVFGIPDVSSPGPDEGTGDPASASVAVILLTPKSFEAPEEGLRPITFHEAAVDVLRQKVPVVPVLVGGAEFPPQSRLHADLQPLATVRPFWLELSDWSATAKPLLKHLRTFTATNIRE